MTYGTGEWGFGPWGGVGDAGLGAPTIDGVSSPLGPVHDGSGDLVDVLGGDVLTIVGSNFTDPMEVEVLSGSLGAYVVEGTCYIFDPRYDLTRTRIYAGSPALPAGLYHVRVRNADGIEAVYEDALAYKPVASQLKIERVRVGLARAWRVGRRLLGSRGE